MSEAAVLVEGQVCGAISQGLCVLLAVLEGDVASDEHWMVERLCQLRVFADAEGKMNLGLTDLPTYGVLMVSQFTLAADLAPGRSRGNRPSFGRAMSPESAELVFSRVVEGLRQRLTGRAVETGIFGASMSVRLVNDGPVTLWLDSRPLDSRPAGSP